MNAIRRLFMGVSLLALAWFTSSCATNSFKEASAVNLELRFYRWDSICITKPDTRDGAFAPVFNVAEVIQEVRQRNVSRDLAVVVVGTGYNETQTTRIATEWHKRLGEQGFRRVVILRGNDGMKIGGLPIIADFAIAPQNEKLPLTNTVAVSSFFR